MAVWPISLPQSPLMLQGFQETLPNTVIRTEMDVGPPKVRQRATAGIRAFTMIVQMTKAQVATLDTFYVSTLAGGSLPFDWTHPRTGAAATYRFVRPPICVPLADDLWQARMELEILP
jgi:hypothetical protein